MNWNAASGQGIIWKVALPSAGTSSPIVWDNRIYVTGGDEHEREVDCFDATTGALLWRHPVPEATVPKPRLYEMTGWASSTPVTDGERVYAIFPTGDLVCCDLQGRRLWQQGYDLSRNLYGHSTSLVTHRGLLYVQLDQGDLPDGLSRLVALDARTGKRVWERQRAVAGSWTTPIIIEVPLEGGATREELITSARPFVIAYDPLTGEEYWRADAVRGDSAPSPVYASGRIFVANIYSKLVALRPGGRGEVTSSRTLFAVPGKLPDICSPVATDAYVFTLNTQGVLSCYATGDGALLWTHDYRLACQSSPSLVGDKVYVITDNGRGFVIHAGPEYRELATNDLGEACATCPAFADGRIYVRGGQHLFCLGAR